MDDNRRRELRDSLERQYQDELAGKPTSPEERLQWLTRALSTYVGRCVGFAKVANASPRRFRSHILFGMVEVGTEVLNAELQALGPPASVLAAWERFQRALAQTTDAADFNTLEAALANWEAALSAAPSPW